MPSFGKLFSTASLMIALVVGSLAAPAGAAAASPSGERLAQADAAPPAETAAPTTDKTVPPASPDDQPSEEPSATSETPAADDETDESATEDEAVTAKEAEVIRRNELLAEIDERYARPPKPSEEPAAAVPEDNSRLPLTIGLSLGLGFLGLLAAMFIVLRPL